ncbi:MAG TPA: hypothetical protein VGB34_10235 [Candidatus Limnocylindria bacterium]|jgi:hypothetical protein
MLNHLDEGGVVNIEDRTAAALRRLLEGEAAMRAKRTLDLDRPFR